MLTKNYKGENMKIPLRFQMTENDSGKITVFNAISYLFDRENVDSALIKSIYKHTINESNILLKQESICEFAKKILSKKKYNLELFHLTKEEVNIKLIKDYFKVKGTIMIIHVYLFGKSHYCLVTKLDNNYIYLFDPYYLDETYFDVDRMIELIYDEPFEYNRKVNMKRFTSMNLSDFSLGPIEHRECLIIQK